MLRSFNAVASEPEIYCCISYYVYCRFEKSGASRHKVWSLLLQNVMPRIADLIPNILFNISIYTNNYPYLETLSRPYLLLPCSPSLRSTKKLKAITQKSLEMLLECCTKSAALERAQVLDFSLSLSACAEVG